MKRSMQVCFVLVLSLGILTSFLPGQPGAASRPEASTQPAATEASSSTSQAATQQSASAPASKPAPPDEIPVSFKDKSIEQIGAFLAEKLGKPVLPAESIKDKKITIISKKKMPLKDALMLLRQAMLDQGIMVEERENLIRLRPVSEVMQAHLPQIPSDVSVGTIDDPLQIVTKEFLVQYYDVQKMVKLIQPILPSFGVITADADSRKLFVTDSVANLLRIERIIERMDVPMGELTVPEIIKVEHGDASEIIGIIRWLIAGRMGIRVTDITTTSGTPSGKAKQPAKRRPGRSERPGRSSPGGASPTGAAVTEIQPSKTPVTLVPHISRNWIIVVAPADMMPQIRKWVKDLDKAPEVEKQYELHDVVHADTKDVAQQITQAIRAIPNTDIRDSTRVVPFGQSKKVIIFGSKTGREIALRLLKSIDIEDVQKRTWRTFPLQHADAEELAERIETLFSGLEVSYKSSWGTSYRRRGDSAKVTVVPDKRRNAITVITDSETMKDIEELIEAEDVRVDLGELKPRVYDIKYADPGELQALLTEMFSGKEPRRRSWMDMMFGSSRRNAKPIGRLMGQFTFQVMPSSRKLIVNAKNAANFDLIDELIKELDQSEQAGLPLIVELKFADAEDLCEQLNALLAEPGTLASIRRASRELVDRQDTGSSQRNGNVQRPGASRSDSKKPEPGQMQFWWQSYRRPDGQVPTSNLIGKIRIVPAYRGNALMVLAPAGYTKAIQKLIDTLDQPSRMVMIKARIGEIQHSDQTTLGLRLASDASLLPPADTAIGGGATAAATLTEAFGSGSVVLGATANVNVLLNMLVKDFDMKILSEPTITTSDNKASAYFDGQDVSVVDQMRFSTEGTTTVTSARYEEAGTRLSVRPHITMKGNVDLKINLEISRIVPGSSGVLGNPTFDRREVTTHVIIKNGQTIMLSGIIRQEHFEEVRKVPLLGDIPLIGKLFRSIDKGTRNRELVVFITPYVMTSAQEVDAVMEEPKETLRRVEESINPEGETNR